MKPLPTDAGGLVAAEGDVAEAVARRAVDADRARVQLKSSLIMQGESTAARSGALVSDWYHLGRVRGLQELSDAIDATTADDVMDYARAFPAEDFTVLVIGPESINTQTTSE